MAQIAALPQLAALTALCVPTTADAVVCFESLTAKAGEKNLDTVALIHTLVLVPDCFPALRLLDLSAEQVNYNGCLDLIIESMRRLACLEELVVYRAGAFGRTGIQQLLNDLPGLRRFAVGYCRKEAASDVSSDWLLSVQRDLLPRMVRCEMPCARAVDESDSC